MSRTRHHGNKAKQRAYGKDWHWLQNYPGWWDTLYHHRPARQKNRKLIHDVSRGDNPTDWPDHRKPHKYYW